MEEKNTRSGFVSFIGRPNVGKSTLMNRMIGQKIAITSDKPQTTRNRIQTVYTGEKGQIVFLDTPGMMRARNKLGKYMMSAASSALKEVDVIAWVIEPETFIGEGERHISDTLSTIKTPVVLVINKIDKIPKQKILEIIEAFRKLHDFAEIVPVSALKGENTDELLDTFFKYIPEGPLMYDEDTITDQPMRQIVCELIREKMLMLLDEEIPHGTAVSIEKMQYREKGAIWDIDAEIYCEKPSHKGIIIGKGGEMLKKIGTLARQDIEELLMSKVNLNLWVKVKKDWRDSDILLKNFGFRQEDFK